MSAKMSCPTVHDLTIIRQKRVGRIWFFSYNLMIWVNCYVFGYADYENQYEKIINIILGGMGAPQSKKSRNFPTFSFFLFFLGF